MTRLTCWRESLLVGTTTTVNPAPCRTATAAGRGLPTTPGTRTSAGAGDRVGADVGLGVGVAAGLVAGEAGRVEQHLFEFARVAVEPHCV